MYQRIQLRRAKSIRGNGISRWLGRRGSFVIFLAATLALISPVRGVTPPPDGGYPNSTTAEGEDALFSLDPLSVANTAVGYHALYSTQAEDNTGVGASALEHNSTGGANTAIGVGALQYNTTGVFNTATGVGALNENIGANCNTANGEQALHNNTSGNNNTAAGCNALVFNTTGPNNTASGFDVLYNSLSGGNNTGNGYNALFNNTTGSNNIAVGASAGSNLTTGSNNIDIGGFGVAGESNTIRLGKTGLQKTTFITGIRGATVAGGVTVMVDGSGHLGTITSSARYKEVIKPMDKASEAILSLKPVTFRYRKELDPEAIPQFGLVAEQVEKVDPDLVARDDQGKPYTVRYEAVNAMLLNEFLKEHRRVEEQEAKLSEQKKEIVQLEATVRELMTTLEKVSARLEAQERGGRLVDNR
jgi:hypothetical protein